MMARPARPGLLVLVLLSISIASSMALGAPVAPKPKVEANGDTKAGHVTLSWESQSEPRRGAEYELQEAESPDFADATVRYRGEHTSSVISGLPDGTYHYRVRYHLDGELSAWSDPVTFQVEHHSLTTAVVLFLVGAVVFGATTLTLLYAQKES